MTAPDAAPFDAVVVAASFGGVKALSELLSGLPTEFPVPVLVVQHRYPTPDLLSGLLRRVCPLPVVGSRPGPLQPATVHVLPPRGGHVLDPAGRIMAAGGSGRPGDDIMVSAARAFGARVCALVLTGRGNDGAAGIRAVKRAGGVTIAQAPGEARAPEMPTAAAATGCLDLVLPLRVLAPALVALAMARGAAQMFTLPPRPWAHLAG